MDSRWKMFAIALLLGASALSGGCVAGQHPEGTPNPPVIQPHSDCQAIHAPGRPAELPPNSVLIWTSPQPSPEHQSVWMSLPELQRLATIRQAMGLYPQLRSQLDGANEQVRLWTAEPEGNHRNAQLRRWTDESERLKRELEQVSIALGQPMQAARPMEFPDRPRNK